MMYKVIKDNKIVGISERTPKLQDSYEVIEDKEHTCEDYEEYNGEYLLKSEIPPPTYEEIDQLRVQYRHEHIDDKTIARMRKTANGTWTEEDEQAYLALDAEVTAWIEENLPYPVENDPEYSILIQG